MSLLNDALRAAEQRQNRPEVTGAYTGQVHPQPAQRRWLIPTMALLLVLAVAVAVYGFLFRADAPAVPATEMPTPEKAPEPMQTAQAPAPAVAEEQPKTTEPNLQTESRVMASSEPAPQTEALASDPEPKPEPKPEPEPEPKAIVADAPVQPEAESVSAEPAPQIAAQPVTQPSETDQVTPREKAVNPVVKQVRETPEAIDRRVSRELARLLRAGESRAAEQKLADLVAIQAAPLSREVYTRAMLVQEAPERALPWVSGAEAESYPALRLLHARALLPLGRLNQAVATLNKSVPPVAEHIEYRITLATLQQQAGQNVEAARHWSALIAVDDSRPAWWVGLAIALEAQGEANGAVKAYAQAAKLPGLSPSLADYVRNRLTLLQAG